MPEVASCTCGITKPMSDPCPLHTHRPLLPEPIGPHYPLGVFDATIARLEADLSTERAAREAAEAQLETAKLMLREFEIALLDRGERGGEQR